MKFGDAAYQVLKETNKPMTATEITKTAVNEGLISSTDKTPEASLGRDIYMEIKKEGDIFRFTKIDRGVFGLKEWENETGRQGKSIETTEVNPEEVGSTSRKTILKEPISKVITRPAALVKQGNLSLYATCLRVADLLSDNFYSIERLDPAKPDDRGFQRLLNIGRAKKLADYLIDGQESQDAFLPTSVFLATDKEIDFDPNKQHDHFRYRQGWPVWRC
jgi:hypothetical protein